MMVAVLNAGSGVTERPRLHDEMEALFQGAGLAVDIREVNAPREIPAMTRAAVDAGAEAVIAGGGDGTVSAVASALAGTPVPLGVVPLGTLNHFAKDLGIPPDPSKAIAVIAARHAARVDVGRVNDRVFVNNCSLGVYPSLVEMREQLRRSGHHKWTAFVLATIDVLRRQDEVTIRLEAHRTNVIARTPFVFVGNNEYQVEGIDLGARLRLNGRRLWVYFAPPVRTRSLPRLFVHALLGIARRTQALATLSAAEMWIDTPATDVNMACDGELVRIETPLHFRSWPGALRVFAPQS